MSVRGRDDDSELRPYEGWTLATESSGDLKINDRNQLAVTEDAHAVRQVLKTALATPKGEDPLDEDFGLDIFSATNSVPHLKREIRRTLLYDDQFHDRVDAVPTVDVQMVRNRHAAVYIEVELDTGQIETLRFTVGGVF